jgi:tetratricopeptide (TPR) repeat protein
MTEYPPGTLLLPTGRTDAARIDLENFIAGLAGNLEARILRCSFDEGGPWAGVRDLFGGLFEEIRSRAPHLLERHGYELVHVLPEVRDRIGPCKLSLTDIASAEERVRNYPADRAMRIVHGLIDLLSEFRSELAAGPCLLVCLDFDEGGFLARGFFRELMRRRGAQLSLSLLLVPPAGRLPDSGGFECEHLDLPFSILPPASPLDVPDRNEAVRRALALESEIPENDTLAGTARFAELIRLWGIAASPDKVLQWRYLALNAYNTLGLYHDALRYGEPVRELIRSDRVRLPLEGRWGLFFKLFMSYLGTGDVDAAYRMAEEDVLTDLGDPQEAPMRIRLCYLIAMLHARFLPERDFERGEQLLALGLEYLQKAGLPEHEHWFQFVFNRNGLAMIRNFQRRSSEALQLCREGLELLEKHLSPNEHHLHRSVLLYNLAQVYVQLEEYDLAIDHFTAAMRMDPNYSEYYNERGNVFLKIERFAEAEHDYRQAIELSPPYHEVWSNLGQCLRLTGRMAEAKNAYSRSLDLLPIQPKAWLGRAQASEALGRTEEAIRDYGRALDLDPLVWQARAGRAVLFYELGDLESSLQELDRAIELAPAEPEPYQNRAVLLADLQRPAEARRDLTTYLDLCPQAEDREEVMARIATLANFDLPTLASVG